MGLRQPGRHKVRTEVQARRVTAPDARSARLGQPRYRFKLDLSIPHQLHRLQSRSQWGKLRAMLPLGVLYPGRVSAAISLVPVTRRVHDEYRPRHPTEILVCTRFGVTHSGHSWLTSSSFPSPQQSTSSKFAASVTPPVLKIL